MLEEWWIMRIKSYKLYKRIISQTYHASSEAYWACTVIFIGLVTIVLRVRHVFPDSLAPYSCFGDMFFMIKYRCKKSTSLAKGALINSSLSANR